MQAKYGTGTVNFKNGKWVWTGYYKDDTGKIKRPAKTFNTEKEALLFQAEQTSKTLIKKEMRSEDITLKRVFELWLSETNEVSDSNNISKTNVISGTNEISDGDDITNINHISETETNEISDTIDITDTNYISNTNTNDITNTYISYTNEISDSKGFAK